jgi:hypothetical protein
MRQLPSHEVVDDLSNRTTFVEFALASILTLMPTTLARQSLAAEFVEILVEPDRAGFAPAIEGDGVFDQLDIVAAQQAGVYLSGSYATFQSDGQSDDAQISVGYDAFLGELWLDAPGGKQLTSVNIDSAAGILQGSAADNLVGNFTTPDIPLRFVERFVRTDGQAAAQIAAREHDRVGIQRLT